jgi:hypothetical protein
VLTDTVLSEENYKNAIAHNKKVMEERVRRLAC